MNDKELREMKTKVDQANSLLASIKSVEQAINTIETKKTVKSIEFEVYGKRGSFMNMGDIDEDEIVAKPFEISAKELGIKDQTFSDIFYEIIKKGLESTLAKLKDEYKKL